jgi:hypothetical protein
MNTTTTPAIMNTMKVTECAVLMSKVNTIAHILDTEGDKMDDGVYLRLYNALGDLCNTDLLVKIETYASRNGRQYKGRTKRTQQEIRHLALQYPDKYAVCPICETGMLKENIKLHYQKTQKCKDIYYTKLGVERCKKCIDPMIQSIINEVYGEPIPPLPDDLMEAGNNAPNYHLFGQ